MKDLLEKKDLAWATFKEKQAELTELVTPFIATDGGIKVSVNVPYDAETIINLEHREYNWTGFLTINVPQHRELTYSHGSGGFNQGVTTEQQLQATQDMFTLVWFYINKQDEIRNLAREVSKAETALRLIHNEIEKLEVKEVEDKAIAELLKTHRPISTDEIMNTIKNGGEVLITLLNITSYNGIEAKLYERSIENRGIKRANYYHSNDRYSKDDLVNRLNKETLYVPIG